MDIRETLRNNLEQSSSIIKNTMVDCFEYMDSHPEESKEIIEIWKEFANILMKDFFTLSEKYDNKEIGKAIGKMIMFRR